jgi:hypothetical protein
MAGSLGIMTLVPRGIGSPSRDSNLGRVRRLAGVHRWDMPARMMEGARSGEDGCMAHIVCLRMGLRSVWRKFAPHSACLESGPRLQLSSIAEA